MLVEVTVTSARLDQDAPLAYKDRLGKMADYIDALLGPERAIPMFGDGSTALVAEDGQAWDCVLLVRYPSRQAFSDMVRDPDYNAGAHLRTESLSEAVLQATVPWTAQP